MDERLLGKCGFYCGFCPAYIRDIYVEQDRKQAEYWFRKAMESDDPDAVEEAKMSGM